MDDIIAIIVILTTGSALFRYASYYYIYIRTTNRNDMPNTFSVSFNPYNTDSFLSLWHDFTFPIDPKYETLRKWSMMSLKLTKILGLVFVLLVLISLFL